MRKGQKAPSYVKKKLSDACTKEKRKLISERMMGDKNPMKRPEVRKKQSDSLKQFYIDHPEAKILTLEQRSRRAIATGGDNSSNKRPEVRKKLSLNKKKFYEDHPEERIKQSIRGKLYYLTHHATSETGRGNGMYYHKKDKSIIWLRSSYEIRYAAILDILGIEWEYEHRFLIKSNNTTYEPDFYLVNYDLYIEVKGYASDKVKSKMFEFYKQYPNIKLIMVWGNHISNLEYELLCQAPIQIEKFGIELKDQLISWNML